MELVALQFLSFGTNRFHVVLRARKGPGHDYWLGKDEDPTNLFEARLDLWHPRRQPKEQSRNKSAEEVKQTNPSDHTLPAYIAVVEFSKPQVQVVKKQKRNSTQGAAKS
jgi:hypothetical protein